jgi:hypothetical protein
MIVPRDGIEPPYTLFRGGCPPLWADVEKNLNITFQENTLTGNVLYLHRLKNNT